MTMQNRLIVNTSLSFLLLVSTSCGTIAARKFDPYDHWGQGYVVQKIYGGTRLDWHTPHLLVIFDLPLSFAADTLLLPLTIYEEYFLDHSLHDAALSGDLAIIKVELDAGRGVESPNEHGHSLLMSATVGLRSEIVEELIKRGADVNARSKHTKCTALLYAVLQVDTQRSIATMSEEKRREARKVIALLKNAGGKIYFKDGIGGWVEPGSRGDPVRGVEDFLGVGKAAHILQ
jgi:uncharacterized protein YceK